MKTSINSEIGKLEGVIIHTPGPELENMIPENAERALYSDILNLSIASREFAQLSGVLNKTTTVFEIKNLLIDILENRKAKNQLIQNICLREGIPQLKDKLADTNTDKLAGMLIEGIILQRNNLTNYLSKEKYSLRPLHNLFFTRDSAIAINNGMLIGRMANPVRERETIIMEAIFKYHPAFETTILNPANPLHDISSDKKARLEGGDFQIINKDTYIIGTGKRTSTQGIDMIIEYIKRHKKAVHHIIVQELPPAPESFIHLDMVFTCLDFETCMIYEPLINRLSPYRTIYIHIENNKVTIKEQPDIPSGLKYLGIDLKSLKCGGANDPWIQEREQWHSGTNFLALAPGIIVGYERNVHTLEELNTNGYEILKASDIISGKISIEDYKKCVIAIAGSELSRGGGGARCMTMPVRRTEVNW